MPWHSQPGLFFQTLRLPGQATFQYQQLSAIRAIQADFAISRPAFQAHPLVTINKQGKAALGSLIRQLPCVEPYELPVSRRKLPKLDEQATAFGRTWPMAGAWWIAHVSPGGVTAMLILEDTLQDEELLPARMGMGCKMATRGIAHDRRSTRHLPSQAIQQATLYPLYG